MSAINSINILPSKLSSDFDKSLRMLSRSFILYIAKSLPNNILHPIEMERCKSVHLPIGNKGKISEVAAGFHDLIFLVVDLPATDGSILYFKPAISFLMFFHVPALQQFTAQAGNAFIKDEFIIGTFFNAE